MRIIAADSGSAILDEEFAPKSIVSVSSVTTNVPYRNALSQFSDLLMAAPDSHTLILKELEMCKKLLQQTFAEMIHIDMSLGGASVSGLTMSDLQNLRISSKGKQNIRSVLPRLRKLASEIEQTYKIEVRAIGKASIPVRIAELTVGASSVVYASSEALESKQSILLGLPSLCTIVLGNDQVTARSLQPGEYDLVGISKDTNRILHRVAIREFNNPNVRGFKALRITPIGP